MHLFTWSGVSVVNTWQYCRFICPLGSLARKENWQWSGSQVAYAIRFNSWNMYSVWGKRPTANTLQLAREKQRNSKLATKYYSPLYSSFLRKCWYLFLNVTELMKNYTFTWRQQETHLCRTKIIQGNDTPRKKRGRVSYGSVPRRNLPRITKYGKTRVWIMIKPI